MELKLLIPSVRFSEIGLNDIVILPPGPGKCPECAEVHDSRLPHNLDSLYYCMKFRQVHGRAPTWADAMAHCPEEIKRDCIEGLAEHGIQVIVHDGGQA